VKESLIRQAERPGKGQNVAVVGTIVLGRYVAVVESIRWIAGCTRLGVWSEMRR
jgi:hypothetical protein